MTHLVGLGASWSLWRTACLRATGFAAERVLELASTELAFVTNQILATEARVAGHRHELLEECKRAQQRRGPQDKELQKAIKRLRQSGVPEAMDDAACEVLRAPLVQTAAELDELLRVFTEQHRSSQQASSRALRLVATDDRFRQALLWQNRRAVHRGVDWLLRQPVDATDSETRKNEALLASYLQRYCLKNDTISFFGPVGWAHFVDDEVGVIQSPGPDLVASRTVYYEYWAIDALATKLSTNPDLKPFIAPRLLPRFHLEGDVMHGKPGESAELPTEYAALAARCDGVRTARQLGDELGFDVTEILDELVEAKLVHWELELPTADAHPERSLRDLLQRIDDEELRAQAVAELDDLERGKAAVAEARTAPELDLALGAFEATFARITDANTERAHGKMYAGRTPLYEDCRRDGDVQIGRTLLARLAPTLEPVLDSARWFTYEIALRYRRRFDAIFEELATAGAVPFEQFWERAVPLFPGAQASDSIVAAVRDELRARWSAILAIDPSERDVHRDASQIAAKAREQFAAPHPGWPAARYQSPDIMLGASDPDAMRRGDYRIVLGELHAGFNTVAIPLFVRQHLDPGAIIAARTADCARAGIAPVWSKAVTRGDYFSLVPRDFDLETGTSISARPRDHVFAPRDFVVARAGDRLEVRTRDGGQRFDVIEFLEHHLIAESFAAFSISAPAPWSPRVTIGDVTIARATWRLATSDVTWPTLKEASQRYLAALRWARTLGLPRWVFLKTPEEVKPVFVDFESPVYVELLAKLLRAATSASISEMLPALDEAWVTDASGARYTGELRIAAVDGTAAPSV